MKLIPEGQLFRAFTTLAGPTLRWAGTEGMSLSEDTMARVECIMETYPVSPPLNGLESYPFPPGDPRQFAVGSEGIAVFKDVIGIVHRRTLSSALVISGDLSSLSCLVDKYEHSVLFARAWPIDSRAFGALYCFTPVVDMGGMDFTDAYSSIGLRGHLAGITADFEWAEKALAASISNVSMRLSSLGECAAGEAEFCC